MKRTFFILLLLIVTTLSLTAQSFTVQAPPRVSVGDKFYVKYVLSFNGGNIPDIHVSQINGCKHLYGPIITGQSHVTQVINGNASTTAKIEYACTYKAEKEGTYTIQPATVTVGGKKLSTRQTSITVAPASRPSQQGQSSAQVSIDDIDSQTADKRVSGKDLFVRIMLSKSHAYEQEAIECTIKLYTKYNISSFFVTKQPAFDGFLVEDVPSQAALNTQETLNGQTYWTALLKKCILFPQKSGRLTIVSGNYDIDVVQYELINMGFYTVREPVEKKLKIESNSASIDITPLPQPQPDGFNGAVGNFNVKTKLSANNFRTNEPVTLSYIISGTGNIKFLKDPVIDFPSEFEKYDPETTSDTKVVGQNLTGTTTIDYTFTPTEVGDFQIQFAPFSYFDPSTKEYKTIDLPPYKVKVGQGAAVAAGRKNVEAKNTDIRYIHDNPGKLSKSPTFMVGSSVYWLAFVLVAGVLAASILLNRSRIRRMSDVSGLRLAKANKVARKRLQLAGKYMKSHDADKFYDETLKALWGYLGDKLSMPASQLSRSNIAAQLEERGVDKEQIDKVIEIIDECEMARYTPSGSQEKIESLYRKATEAINSLENFKGFSKKPVK